METKIDTFLDQVTTGLAADPELRLDVQAELRSHIADKVDELGGEEHADEAIATPSEVDELGGEEHVDRAIAALGEVVELAEEVTEANRRRLGWRNLARRVLRFGLVPVAVVCTILLLYQNGLPPFSGNARMLNWGVITETGWRSVDRWLLREPRVTESQRLLLHGDETKSNRADSFRPLWQSDPANRVYFAEYVVQAMGGRPKGEARAALLADLEGAREIDPENALYPLLAADLEADAAARIAAVRLNVTSPQPLSIMNRDALDQAMPKLLAAVEMPRYDTYRTGIIEARLAALPQPTSLQDLIQREWALDSTMIGGTASAWHAAHLSVAYAQLLLSEGRPVQALPYLRLPEKLGRMVAENACLLIELHIASRFFTLAGNAAPPLLREIGRDEEARATSERLAAIRQPVERWQHQLHDCEDDGFRQTMKRRAGFLAGALWSTYSTTDPALLPGLLDTGRQLEYTVATRVSLAFLALLLLLTMLACLGVYLGWRVVLGSQAAPLLLLPSWRDMVRFVLLGVILPFAGFLVWTHLPFSAHSQGILVAGNRVAAEVLVLLVVLVTMPTWLASRAFRRRCHELDLASPPTTPKLLQGAFGLAGAALCVGACLPAGEPDQVRSGITLVVAGGIGMVLIQVGIIAIALAAPRIHGRAAGTLARSLIPVFAAAILVVSLVAYPIMRARERGLVEQDRILWSGANDAQSPREGAATAPLLAQMHQALAEHPMPPGGEK